MVPGGKEESDNKIVGFSVDYWDDFILFVPSASGCEMEKVNTGTKEKEKRPLLVFVLSIKLSDEAKIDNLTEKKNKKKLVDKLYLFEYIGILKWLELIINWFTQEKNLKVEKFAEWYKERFPKKSNDVPTKEATTSTQ